MFPGGPPEFVYQGVLEASLTLVVSRPLLAELGRVLTDKLTVSGGRHLRRLGSWRGVSILDPASFLAEPS